MPNFQKSIKLSETLSTEYYFKRKTSSYKTHGLKCVLYRMIHNLVDTGQQHVNIAEGLKFYKQCVFLELLQFMIVFGWENLYFQQATIFVCLPCLRVTDFFPVGYATC